MAHGREGPDIVMTTRYVGASEIRAVTDHELNRTPDGSSAIDLERTHLNRVLHGPATQQEALELLWAEGVRKPAAQAERPFVQTVISASPSFFALHDDEGSTGWDQVKLDDWVEVTMRWLKEEYGDDLAHVSLHLDETTPHLHILIVPTYERKSRKPSRRKKSGETAEEFEERLTEWQNNPQITRTAGRSSSKYWSKKWCRRDARISYHRAVEHLGLGYGADFVGDGAQGPKHKTTGTWVREEAARLTKERIQIESEKAKISEDREEISRDLADLEAQRDEISRAQMSLVDASIKIEELKRKLSSALSQVVMWLKRPDLSKSAKADAIEIAKEAHAALSSTKKPPEDSGLGF